MKQHSISFFGNTDSTAGALQSAVLDLNGGPSGDRLKQEVYTIKI